MFVGGAGGMQFCGVERPSHRLQLHHSTSAPLLPRCQWSALCCSTTVITSQPLVVAKSGGFGADDRLVIQENLDIFQANGFHFVMNDDAEVRCVRPRYSRAVIRGRTQWWCTIETERYASTRSEGPTTFTSTTPLVEPPKPTNITSRHVQCLSVPMPSPSLPPHRRHSSS